MLMIKALWSYRAFVVASVSREFHSRYRESLFGALWAVGNPLTMITIYTVIFGSIMGATLPGQEVVPFAFSIYLCSGLITWILFSEMLTRLVGVFLEQSNLIKKANFPRVCLPAIVTLSSLINFSIIFLLFIVFLIGIGHWPGMPLLAVVPLLILQICFTVGLGILLGTLNVFFRDVGQFTGIALQFWFWLTPIVYTLSAVPESVGYWLQFNPMLPVATAYQTIFLLKTWPDFHTLIGFALISLLLMGLGGVFFLRQVGELVDEL